MMTRTTLIPAMIMGAAMLSGCAADGGLNLATGSLGTLDAGASQKVAAAPAIDPACIELTAKIDALRKEGTPERLAKVAAGKTNTASVKRSALARMTELDAANQQFQAKCSNMAASAKPAASAALTTSAVNAASQAATAAAPSVAATVAPKASATIAKANAAAARAQQAASAANAAATLANTATAN